MSLLVPLEELSMQYTYGISRNQLTEIKFINYIQGGNQIRLEDEHANMNKRINPFLH